MSLSKNQLKLIKSLDQKKYRNKLKLFVAEGVKVVKELLEYKPPKGSNYIDPSAEYNYAIRWASENGHFEIVKLLLEFEPPEGSKLNYVDPSTKNNYALNTLVCS